MVLFSTTNSSFYVRLRVSLGECEILADSTFNLGLHLCLHFSLGVSSVAVDNDDIEKNKDDDDDYNDSGLDAIIGGQEVWGVSVQSVLAH